MAARKNPRNSKSLTKLGADLETVLITLQNAEFGCIQNKLMLGGLDYPNEDYSLKDVSEVLETWVDLLAEIENTLEPLVKVIKEKASVEEKVEVSIPIQVAEVTLV